MLGDTSIVDRDFPPYTQPGLWCKWEPTEDGTALGWDGSEKFTNYVPWLEYLIRNFLKPWGYVLSGTSHWQGEHASDQGKIVVLDNGVMTKKKPEPSERVELWSEPELDLYIWLGFGDHHGMMFAIAESVEQAREMLLEKSENCNNCRRALSRDPLICGLGSPVAFAVMGPHEND